MNYKNIQDCWTALDHCYDLEELQGTIQDFPIWTGDRDIELLDEDTVRITNSYFDKVSNDYDEDSVDYETKLTRDSVLDLIPDSIEVEFPELGESQDFIIHASDEDKIMELAKQAIDLYNQNQDESVMEYFKQLVEESKLFILYDFEYNL